MEEYVETTGAVLGGRDGWDETAAAGNRPYGGAWEGPIFVLTHHLDDAVPAEGVTFLDRDVAEAVRIGLEAAGGRRGQGLKPQTVLHVHRTLHKAFKDAVRRGKLGANPAAAVDPPRAEGTRPRVWTAAQLRAFLDGVRDHEFFAAWMLFATTGMRRGEMAGLAREGPRSRARPRPRAVDTGSRGRGADLETPSQDEGILGDGAS